MLKSLCRFGLAVATVFSMLAIPICQETGPQAVTITGPVAYAAEPVPLKPHKKPLTLQAKRASARRAVGYHKVVIDGVPCHVVQVDLRNPHVRLRTYRARDLGTCYRTFSSFVAQTRPIAAITGTFFDIQSGTIISNLVRDGRLLESGCVGRTLSLDGHNVARWIHTAGVAGGRFNWKNSEFAVSSGPSLLANGVIGLNPKSEGFHDPGLFRYAARAGIATTRQGKLLLVTVNQHITLSGFARIMRRLGAINAVNLDGGSSTALYARGSYFSQPRRSLTNVLLVTVRP